MLNTNINFFILPIVIFSYIITILCFLLNYQIFGSPSKTKTWLYEYFNAILKRKTVRHYFSVAYHFHIWLFCVGENKALWFRFNFIISISEILTILCLGFRFFLVAQTIPMPSYIVIVAGIIFALNGLFKMFIRSGFLIQNLINETVENNPVWVWQNDVALFGNKFFEDNRQGDGSTREQSSQSSYTRFFRGVKWTYISTGLTIAAMVVIPLGVEKIRQNFETKARIDNNTEKMARAKLENDSAKLKHDSAKLNNDSAKLNAQAATDRRIAAELELQAKKNSEPRFYKHINDSWNKKP